VALQSKAIPNLIQGVSQQSPQQRRDTQCEEQFDCFNSPVDGCTARPPAEMVAFLAAEDFDGAFCYDIYRGGAEHYLVVIKGEDLRVFDLADGVECTVTFPDGTAYLATTAADEDVFRAATVDDFTFLTNREVVPAASSTTSPAKIEEALFHFKAGAYSTTYTLRITYASVTTEYTYTTPDNSVSGNAQYIATNQLCASLYNALTGTPFSGFSKERRGNVARIWRADNAPFSIDSDDGQGDTHLKVAKGFIQRFSDLPQSAFNGFKIKVQGEKKTQEDDYYVTFSGSGTADSSWQEDLGPGISVGLNAATMPWQLVNTAYRTFVLEQAPWGERVAGDLDTAKNPSFTGKAIQDIFWDNPRLGILVEGSCVWSKSRNPYVFYPDTVQTVLATAPVDVQISASRQIALLRRAVISQDTLTLWAQKAQFRVHSNNEPFKQDTVEAKQMSAYEFAEKSDPCPVSSSLYFATETGAYCTIRDLLFTDGKLRGDTDVTQHVPQYIPAGVRQLVASDTLNMKLLTTRGAESNLYLYNYFLTNQERVQSAWNTWRFPAQTKVLWAGVNGSVVKLLLQRPDGVMLCAINLASSHKDAEGDYLTRMDFRVADTACTLSYNATTDQTTITMPFSCTEANTDPAKVLVVVREDEPAQDTVRGQPLEVVSVSGATVVVKGDATVLSFYAGFRIRAERLESEFYVRSDQGSVPANRLQVMGFRVVHAKTGYYRAEVTYSNGQAKRYEWEGRVLGDPNNEVDKVVLANGILQVPVGAENTQVKIRLVNDSYLPSAWQTAEYQYQMDVRAVPAGGGGARR
jgi:hypothetical protein